VDGEHGDAEGDGDVDDDDVIDAFGHERHLQQDSGDDETGVADDLTETIGEVEGEHQQKHLGDYQHDKEILEENRTRVVDAVNNTAYGYFHIEHALNAVYEQYNEKNKQAERHDLFGYDKGFFFFCAGFEIFYPLPVFTVDIVEKENQQ
jgi:hypothetical protein